MKRRQFSTRPHCVIFRRQQQIGKVFIPAVKAHRGIGGIAPLILNLGHYMELNCRPHAPAAVPPGKESWYELNRKLGRSAFISVCGSFSTVKR